ncbi:hypothetical protein KJ652_07170 [Patescibacteria group bacterium]|nr:hypothetical protein [Patescibacteria group bacterium]MBU1124330.1 hypothetical protein [Patescibacteria group bacterium]MBU1911257.1 hypothetical protein [Patescibacteria group bacterium]
MVQTTCTTCGTTFPITPEEIEFLNRVSPIINDKKLSLPSPIDCFDCRLQRRLAFYNSRTLYNRKCDHSGKQIVSIYKPDSPFVVYDKDIWFSDKHNALDYGRDFDFNRPFFEQFRELLETAPLPNIAVIGTENINSDYTNDNLTLKNCYLIFDGEQAEDGYYGHTFVRIKSCMDFLAIENSELCYECTHCYNCYNTKFSRFCHNCQDSWFLRDCIGCKKCFGCANLHKKEYHIFNKPHSKEEYEEFINNFESNKQSVINEMKNKVEEFFLTQPVKATRGIQTQDSTGDNLNHSKNAQHCFDCNELHDCAYCTDCITGAKDSRDVHIWGTKMELCYNSCVIGINVRNVISGYYISRGCSNVYYSYFCDRTSSNLLGCVGIEHDNNIIFNKKYSEDEYNDLATRIIEHMQSTGEWGQFFPPEISCFGYNETMAQSFFPLEREEALSNGFQWNDYDPPVEADKTIEAAQLPDSTDDIPDDVLNWAIKCEETGRPFRLIKQELAFYRNHKLPIPRRHPDQRHFDRFEYKNPYRLWKRKCNKCGTEMDTAYAPGRPEKVYCESCYHKEVYG